MVFGRSNEVGYSIRMPSGLGCQSLTKQRHLNELESFRPRVCGACEAPEP